MHICNDVLGNKVAVTSPSSQSSNNESKCESKFYLPRRQMLNNCSLASWHRIFQTTYSYKMNESSVRHICRFYQHALHVRIT